MPTMEELELLRAAIAVALADGELARAEKGVIEGLAMRAGVGKTSFEAMVSAAQQGDLIAEDMMIRPRERARAMNSPWPRCNRSTRQPVMSSVPSTSLQPSRLPSSS